MADEITVDEAKSIRFDESHPQHSAYMQGDKDLHAKIDGAYQRQYGRESNEAAEPALDKLTPELQALKDRYDSSKSADGQQAMENPDNEKALADLKARWGPQYETNYQAAVIASEHFAKAAPQLFDMLDHSPLGNDPTIQDALAKIGLFLKSKK